MSTVPWCGPRSPWAPTASPSCSSPLRRHSASSSAAFAAGAGLELSLASWNIALQENVAPSLLARAYSYDTLFSFVAMPIGQLTYGPLAAHFGIRPMLMASGIAYLVLTPVPLLSRDVRRVGRRAVPG